MSKRNNRCSPPDKPMPEYQMFPGGMWHMLSAVMMMVFSLAIMVILVSDMLALWFSERTLMYLELALMVVLAMILTTATFMLSRGWSICHRFLLWQCRLYILVLIFGTGVALISGATGMTITGAVGLGFALIAHYLYRSDRYRAGVEHYRLIWAHHRYNRSKLSKGTQGNQ
ncbi:MAG: hypothetical protein LAT63_14185 [Marinobacter sp.]|nr:hypothetical protein [Marinobacter sp.]